MRPTQRAATVLEVGAICEHFSSLEFILLSSQDSPTHMRLTLTVWQLVN
jgi:hypothetical protein